MELTPEKKLATCDDEKKFLSRNGQIYRSLGELAKGLQTMDEETFSHHASQEKNDFSQWVQDVLGDHTLGQGLLHMSDRESMAKRVELRIRFLELMKSSTSRAKEIKHATKKHAPR